MQIYTVMVQGMLRDAVLLTDHEAAIKEAVEKAEQLRIDRDRGLDALHAIGHLVGLSPGSNIWNDILPQITALTEENKRLKEAIDLDPHKYGIISASDEDLCYLRGAIEFIKQKTGPHDDTTCECNTLAGIAEKIEAAISGEKEASDDTRK
jgi:hypothetical protein